MSVTPPPPEALSEELPEALDPLLLPAALGMLELVLPLGDVVLLPVALGVLLLAPAPVLPALAPDAPEPELCAMETLAIAKSAAAVAVPTSLNIWIRPPSHDGVGELRA